MYQYQFTQDFLNLCIGQLLISLAQINGNANSFFPCFRVCIIWNKMIFPVACFSRNDWITVSGNIASLSICCHGHIPGNLIQRACQPGGKIICIENACSQNPGNIEFCFQILCTDSKCRKCRSILYMPACPVINHLHRACGTVFANSVAKGNAIRTDHGQIIPFCFFFFIQKCNCHLCIGIVFFRHHCCRAEHFYRFNCILQCNLICAVRIICGILLAFVRRNFRLF